MSKSAYLAPAVISYPANIAELNKKVLEEYSKKPLGFVFPAQFSGKKDNQESFEIPDPIQCFKTDTEVFLEDLELLANSLIGCVPVAGPILQGIMTITLNRIKPAKLTVEDVDKVLNEKLPKLKEELIEILDKKIAKAELENYKSLCYRTFNALSKESMELLFDDLVLLRKKLKKGIIPDQSDLCGLRDKFDGFRIDMKASMPMFSNPNYIQHVYPYYVKIMFIYVAMMYQLVFHWYTYGYDADLALGSPAIGNLKETHGYREKIHRNIAKLLKCLQDSVDNNPSEMNKLNLSNMLTYDPICYPIKLIRDTSNSCNALGIRIDVNQSHRPFIFRFDGKYFNGSNVFGSTDSITGCTGIFANPEVNAKVTLSEPKYVSIRFYTSCDKSSDVVPKASINGKELKSTSKFIEMGAFKNHHGPQNIKTGFYHFEKSPNQLTELEVKIDAKDHRVLFCEVTVFDK